MHMWAVIFVYLLYVYYFVYYYVSALGTGKSEWAVIYFKLYMKPYQSFLFWSCHSFSRKMEKGALTLDIMKS